MFRSYSSICSSALKRGEHKFYDLVLLLKLLKGLSCVWIALENFSKHFPIPNWNECMEYTVWCNTYSYGSVPETKIIETHKIRNFIILLRWQNISKNISTIRNHPWYMGWFIEHWFLYTDSKQWSTYNAFAIKTAFNGHTCQSDG